APTPGGASLSEGAGQLRRCRRPRRQAAPDQSSVPGPAPHIAAGVIPRSDRTYGGERRGRDPGGEDPGPDAAVRFDDRRLRSISSQVPRVVRGLEEDERTTPCKRSSEIKSSQS